MPTAGDVFGAVLDGTKLTSKLASEYGLGPTGAAMASYSLPSVANLGSFKEMPLNDSFAKELIETEEEYKGKMKGIRGDFSAYAKATLDFVKHNTKNLEKYRSAITSCIRGFTAKKIDEYRKKLIAPLDAVIGDCKHEKVEDLLAETYAKRFSDQKLKITGSGGILIGDFAAEEKACAENMKKLIEKTPADGFMKLIYGEEASKLGRFKELAKEKLNRIRSKSGKPLDSVNGAVGGIVDTTMKSVGESLMLSRKILTPFELLLLDGKILSLGVAHSMANALSSYDKTMRDYPAELRAYVGACGKYSKELKKQLKDYENYLFTIEKPSVSFDKKVKAKSKIISLLDEMIAKTESIVKDIRFSYMLKSEALVDGGYSTGLRVENKKDESSRLIIIGGWTFGHFAQAVTEVAKRTKEQLNTLIPLSVKGGMINAEKLLGKKGAEESSSKADTQASEATAGITDKKAQEKKEKEKAKAKDKALKVYIGFLEKAKDVYVEAEKAKNNAKKLYDILKGTDEDCKNAFEEHFGGDPSKTPTNKLADNSDVYNKSIDSIAKEGKGFLKLQALYQYFQLQIYVTKDKNGKDTERNVSVIDWSPKKQVVNKKNAGLVVNYHFDKEPSDIDSFFETTSNALQEFKTLGKEVTGSFNKFVKLYKGAASAQEKKNKKAAKEAAKQKKQEEKEAKNKKAEEEKQRKAAEKAAKKKK